MKKVWRIMLWMVGVVIWLGAIALLFWAVTADAEGTVYNIIQTPEKTWTCTLPTARTDGMALTEAELASVEYYVVPDLQPMHSPVPDEAVLSPNVVQVLDDARPACSQVIDFLTLPLGQHYIFARVTDTEGRQSGNSVPVPFVLIRELAPPNAPTGGGFVDAAVR